MTAPLHVPGWVRGAVQSRAALAVERLCVAATVIVAGYLMWQVQHQQTQLRHAQALLRDAQARIRDQSECIATWADAYTARANRITGVNSQHNAATDAVIAATNTVLVDAADVDRAALTRDIPLYKAAVVAYDQAAAQLRAAQQANPIPDSPRLNC